MRIMPLIKNRRGERGSAVAVVLAMVGIMLICVGVNLVAVRSLDRELKLLDKKQVQRLHHGAAVQAASATNSPALAADKEPAHD